MKIVVIGGSGLIGTKARCTCNGELLEAALAIPESGPLALQSETNVMEYRNIRIKTTP